MPISIHAAREGGDFGVVVNVAQIKTFQSTPPVKAATFASPHLSFLPVISIHAAREGGDRFASFFYLFICISIHAAREGGDSPSVFSVSFA